jgi:adenine/guanine phosphoribosyltransferase-like PRPP-binding protein
MIYHGTQRTFDDLATTVKQTTSKVRRRKARYDGIVVRGISGVVVGAPVALALNMPLIVVRKPDERSHGGGKVLRDGGDKIMGHPGERLLFLDDLISLGGTLDAVRRSLPEESKVVEAYLYRDDEFREYN